MTSGWPVGESLPRCMKGAKAAGERKQRPLRSGDGCGSGSQGRRESHLTG